MHVKIHLYYRFCICTLNWYSFFVFVLEIICCLCYLLFELFWPSENAVWIVSLFSVFFIVIFVATIFKPIFSWMNRHRRFILLLLYAQRISELTKYIEPYSFSSARTVLVASFLLFSSCLISPLLFSFVPCGGSARGSVRVRLALSGGPSSHPIPSHPIPPSPLPSPSTP